MSDLAEGRTLAELDRALGLPKGSAFRAFKRLAAAWQEGRDYAVLHHAHDAAAIATLKAGGRLYAASVNVVVLEAAFATAVARELGAGEGKAQGS